MIAQGVENAEQLSYLREHGWGPDDIWQAISRERTAAAGATSAPAEAG